MSQAGGQPGAPGGEGWSLGQRLGGGLPARHPAEQLLHPGLQHVQRLAAQQGERHAGGHVVGATVLHEQLAQGLGPAPGAKAGRVAPGELGGGVASTAAGGLHLLQAGGVALLGRGELGLHRPQLPVRGALQAQRRHKLGGEAL